MIHYAYQRDGLYLNIYIFNEGSDCKEDWKTPKLNNNIYICENNQS